MPKGGNAFRSKASRSRMGSTARTNQNQGGGDKKAGLPPTATMTANRYLAFRHRHPILMTMSSLMVTANPRVQQSRPIEGRPINY